MRAKTPIANVIWNGACSAVSSRTGEASRARDDQLAQVFARATLNKSTRQCRTILKFLAEPGLKAVTIEFRKMFLLNRASIQKAQEEL